MQGAFVSISRHGAELIEYRVESIECRCCPRICAGFYYITPPPRRSDDRHPPAKGGGHSGVVMFGHTLPLSLRRSTINVENVGVRLWQSSAICLRAIRPHFLVIPAQAGIGSIKFVLRILDK